MITFGRRASFLLFAGDITAFVVSLYVTLALRHGDLPLASTLVPYVAPFTFLFALWALVFYAAGLYGKHMALFPSRLPDALVKTQLLNILLAAVFFFLVPIFGIAPKTILALYLVVSLVFVILWRLALYPKMSARPRREQAILIARGPEAEALYAQVNGNARYGILFCAHLPDVSSLSTEAFEKMLVEKKVTLIVADTMAQENREEMSRIYSLTRARRQYQFATFTDVYEEVFDRVAFSQLSHAWFLEEVASQDSLGYALVKRTIDIVGGLVMALAALIAMPFVWVANRMEGPGPLFIAQERFGRFGTPITVHKFRSMRLNKTASRTWTTEEKDDNPITRVGAFLRKTSLDEFPQCINILMGEMSLIGPRNDILGLGERLAEALPYYDARYLATPGITGWAQINQQYEQGHVSPQSIEETKVRLAYDFYYLKHRSLGLDIVIALKTVKRMFFRVSSW